MFFVLSRALWFLVAPSNLLLLVAVVGVALLFTRRAGLGRMLLVISVSAMLIVGYLPIGYLLLEPLENRFPAWDPARGAPDGIVVLGGAINPDLSAARGTVEMASAAERMTMLADLARRYPQARLVFVGGAWGSMREREADHVVPLLESFGIPPTRIELERESRNTAENAAFARRLVEPKAGERWLLVTSAAHMPRAVGAFRRAGFPIEAFPVDWKTAGFAERGLFHDSFQDGLYFVDAAAREWIGLVAYRLTGRTNALLPAPDG